MGQALTGAAELLNINSRSHRAEGGAELAMEIEERLFALQDKAYRDFHKNLVPTVPSENIIGVRTPALRKLAKEIVQVGEAEDFLARLPHRYFDENQLHAFIISGIKDYGECMVRLQECLPYIDN